VLAGARESENPSRGPGLLNLFFVWAKAPMPEASDRSQFHSGSWGFHMEHRDGTPPWDTRPDLVAVPATKPDVVIRGYDDRGDESAERAVPPPGARQSHRSPSRPGNSHPAAYLLLTCLGVLVLPGVIAVALWLRSGWSLPPAVLIPPSSGLSGGSALASGAPHTSHSASGPGNPTHGSGHEAQSSGAGPTPGDQVTAGGSIPSSTGRGARATTAATSPGTAGGVRSVNSALSPSASAGGIASHTSPAAASTSARPGSSPAT
jgi:hypothetical protein